MTLGERYFVTHGSLLTGVTGGIPNFFFSTSRLGLQDTWEAKPGNIPFLFSEQPLVLITSSIPLVAAVHGSSLFCSQEIGKHKYDTITLNYQNITFMGEKWKFWLIPDLKQWETHSEIIGEFSVTEAHPWRSERRNNHVTAFSPSFTVVCIL